ncbi:MAG: hypothetical protein H8D45_27085 [Bacteroidetes bacterium]|nr:hypothetical protein [Bacteroidota bacterium]MBL7102837.1 hypothetical protein [Bacteroidales bacterium]
MKKLTFTFVIVIAVTIAAIAQPPQAFKYQAVVRDNSGEILQNQAVGVRISIHEGSAIGEISYQETFTETTNQFGIVNLEIGNGIPSYGTFSSIDWSNNLKFIETEIDPLGGTAYVSVGTSELLAVPYALYSDRSKESIWVEADSKIYYKDGNVGIGTSSPQGELHVNNQGEWLGITFNGTGLNDLTVDHSNYNGSGTTHYIAEVTNAGPNPNLFKWSNDNGTTWTEDVQMAISGIDVGFEVTIGFGAVYGHTYGDQWLWEVSSGFMDGLIVKDGNVGIGTTPVNGKFFVKSAGYTNGMYVLADDNDRIFRVRQQAGGGGGVYVFDGSDNPTAVMNGEGDSWFIGGYVGIGTTNPTYMLDVGGGLRASGGVLVDGWYNFGIEVLNAHDEGLFVYESDDDGVYSSTEGIFSYGFYTPDRTYSAGGYFPAKSGTFAKNDGHATLESGDLVCILGGYEENVLGEAGVHVVNVTKANEKNSHSIFGVVESRVYIREKTKEMEDGETLVRKSFRFKDGNVIPGDYLSVIIVGIADVKVDRKENIEAGQKLTVSEIDGKARQIKNTDSWTVGILGKALENSDGSGALKVFVNCK